MKSLKQLTLGLIFSIFAGNALALDAIYTPWYSNVAIEGYDPVAYFLENKAVEGKKAHKLDWQSATWQFASAENKALFEANPDKYAPQYGGYCAWAVSQNTTASIDPDQFSIVDGKLYLNYDKEVKTMWLVDTTKHISVGDTNWPLLLANK
jgi:YHS domain-containing protein